MQSFGKCFCGAGVEAHRCDLLRQHVLQLPKARFFYLDAYFVAEVECCGKSLDARAGMAIFAAQPACGC